MLAIKVIFGLCMALLVQAETEKLNVIRALSNDQVSYPINLTEIDQLNYFKIWLKYSIGAKVDLILDLLAEQESLNQELKVIECNSQSNCLLNFSIIRWNAANCPTPKRPNRTTSASNRPTDVKVWRTRSSSERRQSCSLPQLWGATFIRSWKRIGRLLDRSWRRSYWRSAHLCTVQHDNRCQSIHSLAHSSLTSFFEQDPLWFHTTAKSRSKRIVALILAATRGPSPTTPPCGKWWH